MSQFKAGDVVCLKSGGPDMTIESIQIEEGDQTISASCVWFDGRAIQRTTLPLSTLHETLWPIAA